MLLGGVSDRRAVAWDTSQDGGWLSLHFSLGKQAAIFPRPPVASPPLQPPLASVQAQRAPKCRCSSPWVTRPPVCLLPTRLLGEATVCGCLVEPHTVPAAWKARAGAGAGAGARPAHARPSALCTTESK